MKATTSTGLSPINYFGSAVGIRLYTTKKNVCKVMLSNIVVHNGNIKFYGHISTCITTIRNAL